MTHQLVAYDIGPMRIVAQHDVPAELLPLAKLLARVGPDDPDATQCYDLAPEEALVLAKRIGVTIDPSLDWFFAGVAE